MLQDKLHVFRCPFFRTLIYLGGKKNPQIQIQIMLFIPLLFFKIVVIEWLPLLAAVFTSKRTDRLAGLDRLFKF